MTVIIDYNIVNLASVLKAFKAVGEKAVIVKSASEVLKADRIVLPGVGSFSDGIRNINELNLGDSIKEVVLNKQRPFLGICLGMQLLASEGFEFGKHNGLGIIKGLVKKIECKSQPTFLLPHMGWNDVLPTQACGLFSGINERDMTFYFAHSYHFIPSTDNVIAAKTSYGINFVSTIQQDNIVSTQFHPEKSQENGFTFLKNFLKI